jgi:hypothetical protein
MSNRDNLFSESEYASLSQFPSLASTLPDPLLISRKEKSVVLFSDDKIPTLLPRFGHSAVVYGDKMF